MKIKKNTFNVQARRKPYFNNLGDKLNDITY